LNDVTLTSPNIGPSEWTDSQHTHASAATAGSTLGPGTTLSTPTLTTPSVTGVMTFTDATLQRTGAGALRLDTNLGVGVAPAAWGSTYRALQVGRGGAVWSAAAGFGTGLADNTYFDGTNYRAIATGFASRLFQSGGQVDISTAPSVAAGATQTFTQRLMLDQAGNLGLGGVPDAWGAGYPALQIVGLGLMGHVSDPGTAQIYSGAYFNGTGFISQGAVAPGRILLQGGGYTYSNAVAATAGGQAVTWRDRMSVGTNGTLTLNADAGQPHVAAAGALILQAADFVTLRSFGADRVSLYNQQFYPLADNAVILGDPTHRWQTVYAVTGAINTSLAEAKQDITPLDPAAALAAVLATDPVTFTYTTPAPTAAQYELPDDPEQAEQVLHQRLVNAPLQEAARSQAGFVLHDETGGYQTDPLFETGFGQSNAANSAGILLAALHELNRRLTAGGL